MARPTKGSDAPARGTKGRGATTARPKAARASAPAGTAESVVRRRPERDELTALWSDFKQTGSAGARERLILHYAPLVKYVASRVATGLPASVEQSDLVSYGMFGLIDALEKFEPARGNKFETYAIPRIKGAIIDELRAMDWVPRSVRAKARQIEKAYAGLEADLK
ncbi:MAG TPA: sigma-70 family RNA polymerase sigma factor, partial [Actinomycetota bacterium]|nr:sigma-70 family RNA polymerase sigma factor [Actinomycetota bacterium]